MINLLHWTAVDIEAEMNREERELEHVDIAATTQCCKWCGNVSWNDRHCCHRHGHKIADDMNESCADFVALFPDEA